MAKSFQFNLVFKGLFIAAFSALILAILYGTLLALTSVSEVDYFFTIIYCLSVFIGSFWAANQAGTKGIYYGIAIGVIFVLVLIILSAIFSPIFPGWVSIGEKLLFGVLAGGLGGIAGVLLRR